MPFLFNEFKATIQIKGPLRRHRMSGFRRVVGPLWVDSGLKATSHAGLNGHSRNGYDAVAQERPRRSNAGAHGSIKLFLLKFRSEMPRIVQETLAFFGSCCPLTLAIVWARNCFTLPAAVSRSSAMAFTY